MGLHNGLKRSQARFQLSNRALVVICCSAASFDGGPGGFQDLYQCNQIA